MSLPKLEYEQANVVLVGGFNPQIFQPAWFAKHNLLGNSETESAKIGVIHPEIVDFVADWCHLNITQERFVARTSRADCFPRLRDLVKGTFTLLRHTPVRQMGLNREFHYSMPTNEAYHDVGYKLAPKEPWTGILEKPGMRSVAMQGQRPDTTYKGLIFVVVEPSRRVKDGVFLQFNDHYEAKNQEAGVGCDELIDVLSCSWDISLDRSKEMAEKLLKIQ